MATLTFNDLFTSDLLAGVAEFSLVDMVISLVLAFVLGLFILFVYKKSFSGVVYSSGFAISIVAMALITTMIILAIGSNIILSLGMVGALSIVRFRSAVKDPMDIAYLFWAISVGIVLGAGLIPLAVFGSVFIGAVLYLFSIKKPTHKPYIFIVDCDSDEAEKAVFEAVKASVKKYVLRSKTVNPAGIELTLEVRLSGLEGELVNSVSRLDGVSKSVLVSYNGEYMT